MTTEARQYGLTADEVFPEGPILTSVRMVLDAPARMMTMNWERGTSNRWAIAKVTDLWRRAAAERAAELLLPSFTWVEVDVYPYQRAGVLADTAAHTPCAKACLDGIQDAGIIANDRGAEVHWIRMHPPQRGPNGLVLELRGPRYQVALPGNSAPGGAGSPPATA